MIGPASDRRSPDTQIVPPSYCTRTHSTVFDMMPEPATISKPAAVFLMVMGTNWPSLIAKT